MQCSFQGLKRGRARACLSVAPGSISSRGKPQPSAAIFPKPRQGDADGSGRRLPRLSSRSAFFTSMNDKEVLIRLALGGPTTRAPKAPPALLDLPPLRNSSTSILDSATGGT